jgi:membrane fusion protein (multidrug efflux system)
MQTTLTKKTIVRLALILIALSAASCTQEEVQTESKERVVAVKALVVQPADRQVTRSYTGALEGEQQAVLRARLSEVVTEVRGAEGKQVGEDEIVITLDKYGPTSQYPQTLSQYTNAKKNYDKMEFLYKEGAIAETEFDAAKTQYEVAKAQFEATSRTVEVHSPIAGTVTSVTVSPGDLAMAGQELATVATTDKLRVKFGVNAEEIAFFRVGADIIVTSDAVNNTATGRVVTLASSADPVSRSFQVEGLIDNPDGLYAPGMFVHVAYILERLSQVVAVPREAVMNLEGKYSVFTAVDGKAQKRQVSLGSDLAGDVVITSGLAAGDTLVTLGHDYLEDGLKLNLTEIQEQAR